MKFFLLIKSGSIALDLTLIVTLVAISPSWAGSNCTLRDLKGSYGYSEQGFVINGSTQTFFSEAGILTADGQGHFSGTALAIWAPSPFEQPLTLVFSTTASNEGYTVNLDCTGDATFSVTITDKNGIPVPVNPNGSNILPGHTIHFVLDTPHKGEFKFISTVPGTVATGSADKQ